MKDERVYGTLQKEIDDFEASGRLSPVITYAESLEMKYLSVLSIYTAASDEEEGCS